MKLFLRIFLIISLYAPTYGGEFIPTEKCTLVVASRSSLSEVKDYIKNKISNHNSVKIYLSDNGWYAITIGLLNKDEAKGKIQNLKSDGNIPNDAYCSKGTRYIQEVKLDKDLNYIPDKKKSPSNDAVTSVQPKNALLENLISVPEDNNGKYKLLPKLQSHKKLTYSYYKNNGDISLNKIVWTPTQTKVFVHLSKGTVWYKQKYHCTEHQGFLWACSAGYNEEVRFRIRDNKSDDLYYIDIVEGYPRNYTATGKDEKGKYYKYKASRETLKIKSSRTYTLLFNDRVPSSTFRNFDLLETSGWNFYDLGKKYSVEEEREKETIIKVFKKLNISTFSPKLLTSTIKKYNKYPSVQNHVFNVLHKNLLKEEDINMYLSALDGLDADFPGTKSIANELANLIWHQLIKSSDDINVVKNFIMEFESASGDIISEAYDLALKLEKDHLEDNFKTKMSNEENTLSKYEIQERMARRLFIEAVQAKEDDDHVTFTLKYYVSTRNSLFKETEAAFNLYRDKEMKRFFKEQFSHLKESNRDATNKIIDSMKDLSTSLTEMAQSGGDAPSQEEVDQQNRRFLMQSYIFDKTMRSTDK